MTNRTMQNNYNRNGSYHIDGNTVRRTQAAPDYRRDRNERIQREQVEELRRRKRAAVRNREKALRMSKSYVVFLTMAVTVF